MRAIRAPKDPALTLYGWNGRCGACANRLRRALAKGPNTPSVAAPVVALTAEEKCVLRLVGAILPDLDRERVLTMLGISSERVNA